jgi:hypothetical protein
MAAEEVAAWLAYLDAAHGDTAPLRLHIAAQEAAINALANELTDTAAMFSVANGPCWGCHSDTDHRDQCLARRAALRMAGRLP